MTKFKEYLRARETEPEYDVTAPYNLSDFEINTCAGIETTVETRIMDGCIVAVVYSNIADPEYAVYDRSGACRYMSRSEYQAHVGNRHHDPEYPEYIEYIDFLRGMGYIDSDWALTVMRNTYEDHAKVRIAFKHMKAGIMDAKAFCKLALRYRFY